MSYGKKCAMTLTGNIFQPFKCFTYILYNVAGKLPKLYDM